MDTSGDTLRRMIVFGGAPDSSTAPTDLRVWELRFDNSDPSSATWSEMDTVDLGFPPPGPRRGHAGFFDLNDPAKPRIKNFGGTTRTGLVAFVHGGDYGGNSFSDSLWGLWILNDGRVGWELLEFGGDDPGPRADHTITFDYTQGASYGRLYLFGGRSAPGTLADSCFYAVDPWDPWSEWDRWLDVGFSLADHTMLPDVRETSARVAEVFTPSGSSGSWSPQSAHLLQRTYPPTFLVPAPAGANEDSMRVVTIGQDNHAYWYTTTLGGSFGQWNQHVEDLGFAPETGVTYEPGKILLAGGRIARNVVGTSKTLDATNMTNGWQTVDSLTPRFFHNLVLLPTGQVLVLGGVDSTSAEAVGPAVKRPQLWTPSTGQWTDPSGLAAQGMIRNYHSSSILLPDARIVSSSGERIDHKYSAEVFCPPYLFKPGTSALAARPEIDSLPAAATWGQIVTVCTEDVEDLKRVTLLRPGATTHSFDENQRFVELDFLAHDDPPRAFVTLPAGPDFMPPGEHLLFLIGSSESDSVPSVARWLQLQGATGFDACDVFAPDSISTLWPELIAQDEMYLTWQNTADDSSIGMSGPVQSFDLRRSLQHINDEAGWSTAYALAEEPEPDTAGVEQAYRAEDLQSCTEYYFALRVMDDANHLSSLHPQVKAKTLCSGGGGGDPNSAVGEVVNAETGQIISATRGETRRTGLSTQTGGGGSAAAALVVETEPLGGGAWRFTLRAPAEFEDADASRMLRQVKDASGAWQTQSDLDLEGAGAHFGLAATGRAGRKVFPGTWELVEIASMLRTPAGDLALASAEHSSLGDLAQSTWSGDGSSSLASGETLTLVYEPSELETAATQNWFALLQLEEGLSSPMREVALGQGVDLPHTFALYQNQPNPFSHTTNIRFDLPKPASVRLTIYDIAGRKVRTLTSSDWPAGRHSLEWDHRSDAGVQLGAGAYIYRLVTNEFQSDKKMILLAR